MNTESLSAHNEQCAICSIPAIATVKFYTNQPLTHGSLPFCNLREHEFAVCSLHRRDKEQLTEFVVSRHAAEFGVEPRKINSYTEADFKKFRPFIVGYEVIITPDEISLALTKNKGAVITRDERRLAQQRVVQYFLFGVTVGIIGFLAGIGFSYYFSFLGLVACFGSFIWLALGLFSVRGSKSNTGGTESALEAAKQFYSEVFQFNLGSVATFGATSAFLLLSGTARDRPNAGSINNLKEEWNKVLSKLREDIVHYYYKNLEGSEPYGFNSQNPIITISGETDGTALVKCEMWCFMYKNKTAISGWVIARFNNVAVKTNGKWYLVAGEPGQRVSEHFLERDDFIGASTVKNPDWSDPHTM